MSKTFNPDEYVDVAERIGQFYEKYPDGRLTQAREPYLLTAASGREFVVYQALAYRTPDDPLPGLGTAWEPLPGPTPFTKDSEIQNAETAAWGRAIVAVGLATKKIASRQEAQARQTPPGMATDAQRRAIFTDAAAAGLDQAAVKRLVEETTGAQRTVDLTSEQVELVRAVLRDFKADESDLPWNQPDFETPEVK